MVWISLRRDAVGKIEREVWLMPLGTLTSGKHISSSHGIAKPKQECYIDHVIQRSSIFRRASKMIYVFLPLVCWLTTWSTHIGASMIKVDHYILQFICTSDQMKTEDECVVALLHDVMEDTGFTQFNLKDGGISIRLLR